MRHMSSPFSNTRSKLKNYKRKSLFLPKSRKSYKLIDLTQLLSRRVNFSPNAGLHSSVRHHHHQECKHRVKRLFCTRPWEKRIEDSTQIHPIQLCQFPTPNPLKKSVKVTRDSQRAKETSKLYRVVHSETIQHGAVTTADPRFHLGIVQRAWCLSSWLMTLEFAP